jgi:putative transposase
MFRDSSEPGASGWLAIAGVGTLYIEPGALWKNGYAESFNGTVRDELLNTEEFGTALEAQALAREWRHNYNHVRIRAAAEAPPGRGTTASGHGSTAGSGSARRPQILQFPEWRRALLQNSASEQSR